jgi:type 1 fimbria pilin
MKKSKWFLALAAGLMAATLAPSALAAPAKEVNLNGTMVCGKCKLHITKECQDVLQVEKGGKTVDYFLTMNKVAKDFHPNICQNDGEKVTVTGKVSEKGGKEVMVASAIKEVK